MQLSEIVDRYTVFRLRNENGMNCPEELKEYEDAVDDLRIDKNLVERLYEANKAMWPLHHDVMESENEVAGKIAKRLLLLNGVRSEIKAEIAKKYGGFEEHKTYATAEDISNGLHQE